MIMADPGPMLFEVLAPARQIDLSEYLECECCEFPIEPPGQPRCWRCGHVGGTTVTDAEGRAAAAEAAWTTALCMAGTPADFEAEEERRRRRQRECGA